MKNLRFLALLLFVAIKQGKSDIKCELKSGVNSALNKVGSAALRGLYYHSNRNSQNMYLMDCYCIEQDDERIVNVTDLWSLRPHKVRFNDDYVDDLNEQFDENWYEAEIFRIHSCNQLQLRMEDGKDSLGDWFRQKLLIVENITALELTRFDVGKVPSSDPADTFSSIYFRDVTFTDMPNDFVFEDRYEVVFERVKISPNINYATKMEVFNKNASIDSVFRLTESEFPGVEDVTSADINENRFILKVTNRQEVIKDDPDDQCEYDYKGQILISHNYFGHLRQGNFEINGAAAFKFENNAIDTINGQAFDFVNVENIHMIGNQFGFVLKSPVVFAFYKARRSECDDEDLPEKRIGKTIVKHNKFSRLNQNFFIVDDDPSYSSKFVDDMFEVAGNDVSKRCNCTQVTLADEDEVNTKKNAKKILKMLQESSKCLSDQTPPLIGSRADICKDILPKTSAQLKIESSSETAGKWTIYLIVAIFVTMLLTAIITFGITMFCCNQMNKSQSRMVSPAN